MKTCVDYAEDISAMIDGELNASDTVEVNCHIKTCDNCQKLYADFTAMHDGFPDMEIPPDTLVGGTLYRMSVEPTTIPAHRWRRVAASLVGVAACLALALFLSNQPTEVPYASGTGDAMMEGYAITGDNQSEEQDDGSTTEESKHRAFTGVTQQPDVDMDASKDSAFTAPSIGEATPNNGENAIDLPLPAEGGGASGYDGGDKQDTPPPTELEPQNTPSYTYTREIPPEFDGKDAMFFLTLRVNDEGYRAIWTMLGEESMTVLSKNGYLAISSLQISELTKAAQIELGAFAMGNDDETGILYLEMISS